MNTMNTVGVRRTAKDALMCKSSAQHVAAGGGLVDGKKGSTSRCSGTDGRPPPVRSQLPLLDCFYSLRSRLIHALLKVCIDSALFTASSNSYINKSTLKICESRVITLQLLILGCGLDESYYPILRHFCATDSSFIIEIFEVDFPEIIAEKSAKSNSFSNCRSGGGGRLVRIPADLSDSDSLMTALVTNKFKFGDDAYSVVLLECVSCYIPTSSISRLFSNLRKGVNNLAIVDFEPMLKSPSSAATTTTSYNFNTHSSSNDFATYMSRKFDERGAPIRHSFETKQEHMMFLSSSCGFAHNVSLNLHEAHRIFVQKHLIATYGDISNLVLNSSTFDEFSSLTLLLLKYCINISSNCRVWFDSIYQHLFIDTGGSSSSTTDSRDIITRSDDLSDLRMASIERRLTQLEENLTLASDTNSFCSSSSSNSSSNSSSISGSCNSNCISMSSSSSKKSNHSSGKSNNRSSQLSDKECKSPAKFTKIKFSEGRYYIFPIKNGQKIRIRLLSDDDAVNAQGLARVYEEGFIEAASRYRSVAKFVRNTMKQLQKGVVTDNSDVSYFVATVADDDADYMLSPPRESSPSSPLNSGKNSEISNNNENYNSNNNNNNNNNENDAGNSNSNSKSKSKSNSSIESSVDQSSSPVIACAGLRSCSPSSVGVDGVWRWELVNFSVAAAWRSQGIGAAVLTRLIDVCRRSRASIIKSELLAEAGHTVKFSLELSVLSDFAAAIRLYRKHGFVHVKTTGLDDGCIIEHYALGII